MLYTGLWDGRVVALDENGENPRDIFFTGGVVSSVGRGLGSTTGVDYGTRLLSTCRDKVLLCLFVYVVLMVNYSHVQKSQFRLVWTRQSVAQPRNAHCVVSFSAYEPVSLLGLTFDFPQIKHPRHLDG